MYRFSCKRNWLSAAAVCVGLWAAAPVQAEEAGQPGARPAQAELRAEASAELAQDTVRLTLAAETDARDQAAVARELNERLERVLPKAKQSDKVEAASGDYRVWPSYDKEGKLAGWRGRAEVLLTSTDFAAASALAASVSEAMAVSRVSFFVSREARAKQEQALLKEAVDAFRHRAQALTEALGYQGYDIRRVDLGGEGRVEPMPRMMAMAAGAAADQGAALPLEGGKETVSVALSGVILLRGAPKP